MEIYPVRKSHSLSGDSSHTDLIARAGFNVPSELSNGVYTNIIKWGIMFIVIFASFIPTIPNLYGDTFLFIATLFVLTVWLIKMIKEGVVQTRYTVLDTPLIAIAIVGLIAVARTVYFYDSWREFIKLITYIILAFIVLNYQKRKTFLELFSLIVIGTSLILAITGIYEYYWGIFGSLAGNRPLSFLPNPNHLAGYLSMAMVLTVYRLWFKKVPAKQKIFLGLIFIINFWCFVLARSKGGIISLVLSFFVLFWLKKPRLAWMFLLGVLVIFIGIISINPIKKVVFTQTLSDPYTFGRIPLWKETIKYIRDYLFLGTGLNTFRYFYPQYKSMPEMRSAEFAHNEFLNIWAEMGLLGLLSVGWLLYIYFQESLQLLNFSGKKLFKTEYKPIICGVFAATTGILAQSLVEFNLHTPALAVSLTLMGAGVMALVKEKQGKVKVIKIQKKTLATSIVTLVGLFVLILFCLPLVADCYYRTGEKYYDQKNYLEAMFRYEKAVKLNPFDVVYRTKLADTYLAEGLKLKDYIFVECAYLTYKKCLQISPRDLFIRRKLAHLFARFGKWELAQKEYEQILELAPNVSSFKQESECIKLRKKP